MSRIFNPLQDTSSSSNHGFYTTISGSNVNATDTLNITTHDLNVLASTDTTASKSDSKDLTASVGVTMYGGSASSAPRSQAPAWECV